MRGVILVCVCLASALNMNGFVEARAAPQAVPTSFATFIQYAGGGCADSSMFLRTLLPLGTCMQANPSSSVRIKYACIADQLQMTMFSDVNCATRTNAYNYSTNVCTTSHDTKHAGWTFGQKYVCDGQIQTGFTTLTNVTQAVAKFYSSVDCSGTPNATDIMPLSACDGQSKTICALKDGQMWAVNYQYAQAGCADADLRMQLVYNGGCISGPQGSRLAACEYNAGFSLLHTSAFAVVTLLALLVMLL